MAKATFATKLEWIEIDPSSLAPEYRQAYEAYKAAYRAAKEARNAFEQSMQTEAPSGKRLVFGYNFGKLSMALDDAKDAPKAKAGVQSLASFLQVNANRAH